jgi:hypothetical protein
MEEAGRRRVVAMDTSVYADQRNGEGDVIVAASYAGVTPARMLVEIGPRGYIGHDACGDRYGGAVAGLPYLEALGIPAAAADGMTAELGDGVDLYENGLISRANALAESCGVKVGAPVADAARQMLQNDPAELSQLETEKRQVMETSEQGQVVVTDSILFAGEEDRGRSVLVVGGYSGRTSAEFFLSVSPIAFIASDGGRSKNDSGIAGLAIAAAAGLPGASVDAATAPMGDAMAAYRDGLIGDLNQPARARGASEGMTVAECARLLLRGGAWQETPR